MICGCDLWLQIINGKGLYTLKNQKRQILAELQPIYQEAYGISFTQSIATQSIATETTSDIQ